MTTTLPSFIDLRAFAAAPPSMPGSDPFGANRRILPLREGPVEVGSIALPAGKGTAGPVEGDWWIVAAEGAVVLSTDSGDTVLESGESCVIAAGTAFAWRCDVPANLIFMCYTRAATTAPAVIPIDHGAELTPSGAPLAELLLGETPSCRNNTMFRSADGEFTCGVWDSTPYHRRAMRYGHFELMVLLRGSVTFIDEAGRTGTFTAGDIFLVEQGANCSWESLEDVAKVYAIYRPLA